MTDTDTSCPPESLLEWVRALAAADHDASLVPCETRESFLWVAQAIAHLAAQDAADATPVVVDAETAQGLGLLPGDDTQNPSANLYVVGGPAEAAGGRVRPLPWPDDLHPDDRFLLVCSASHDFAVVGAPETGPGGVRSFRAVWTALRPLVRQVASRVTRDTAGDVLAGCAGPDTETDAGCSPALMQLVSRFIQHLTVLHHDIARDKADLFSVLEILKAISAKRRSHDILFVFVEQVARVVPTRRCSVVRVWGREDYGHVLASHEDERVADLHIDLRKYPEICAALESRTRIVIDDVLTSPVVRECAADFRRAAVSSLVVVPIVLHDAHVGSLFLRAARHVGTFSPREVSFLEIVAEAAANALERAHLFESIQKANERLELLAVTDGLTGLYNHRHFRHRLDEEFERARRYGLPLSCALLDIDDFKSINDGYGHLQGDRVLRELAARVLRVTRKSDIVARYGGEEFAILMPQTDQRGAKAQAERLLMDIRRRPYNGLPPEVSVTVSMGVAVYDPATMTECEALVRAADLRLYEAKRSGKNRVAVPPDGELPT